MRKVGRYILMHEDELERLAFRDTLTGLPNRDAFMYELERMMAEASRGKYKLGLLYLDLNGFKKINDTLGHHAGDEVLVRFAGSLQQAIRTSDIPARLGGDEFVVLLPHVNGSVDLKVVAEKVCHLADSPVKVGNHELWVAPSIGGSIYPDDSTDVDELIKLADSAMYKAKMHLDLGYVYHGEGRAAEPQEA